VAAGPVGRTSSADTDAKLHAEILSYSRSRGAFAGISLDGATLRPDHDSNAELYGRKLTNEQIVNGKINVPRAGSKLTAELNRYSASKEAKKD
jgi:lipid-binding SYLF domain-containing protein